MASLSPGQGPIVYPFTVVDLTSEIETLPTIWGRINELGVFPTKGVTSEFVEIGIRDGVIYPLSAKERGSEGDLGVVPGERSIILKVPHFPDLEVIKPEDLQDKFVFGSGRKRLASVETATADKLVALRRRHDITLEYLRMGGLKGLIIDGSDTVLYNLFEVFGIEQTVVDFHLDDQATDVGAICDALVDTITLALAGDVMNGVRALVSQEFFAKFTSHPNVEKFFINWQAATALSSGPLTEFPFRGVTFEKYIAGAPNRRGQSRRFIAANEGHAFPIGTQDTFLTAAAPPHHVDFVNTEGVEVFVSPEVLKHGAGVELRSQSNVLPIAKRPATLIKLTA